MNTTQGFVAHAEALPARETAGQLYPWIPGGIGGTGIAREGPNVLIGRPW